jgi:type IV secretion system protein VirD4
VTPTKLLLGQILILLLIIGVGLWVAIQWVAVMLAYQPELGAP